MKCARTWSRSIARFGVCAFAVTFVSESSAQTGYRAGKREQSITLRTGDSSDGSSRRGGGQQQTTRQPQQKNMYPGALRKQPPAKTTTPNWGSNVRRPNPNWTLGGERWRPINPRNDGINGAAGLNRRNLARIEDRLRELYQQRQVARIKYEHGGGYDRDLNDYRALDRRIRELQAVRGPMLRSY